VDCLRRQTQQEIIQAANDMTVSSLFKSLAGRMAEQSCYQCAGVSNLGTSKQHKTLGCFDNKVLALMNNICKIERVCIPIFGNQEALAVHLGGQGITSTKVMN